jgi:small subunit ribosomal protein S9
MAMLSHAVGKRKTASARVFLKEGAGKIMVNGRSIEDYFPTAMLQNTIKTPLRIVQREEIYDVAVNVGGGGVSAQAQAVRHGIARALVLMNPELRPVFKKEGLLTRDPREKERKKYGQPGARKRFQYSKR